MYKNRAYIPKSKNYPIKVHHTFAKPPEPNPYTPAIANVAGIVTALAFGKYWMDETHKSNMKEIDEMWETYRKQKSELK